MGSPSPWDTPSATPHLPAARGRSPVPSCPAPAPRGHRSLHGGGAGGGAAAGGAGPARCPGPRVRGSGGLGAAGAFVLAGAAAEGAGPARAAFRRPPPGGRPGAARRRRRRGPGAAGKPRAAGAGGGAEGRAAAGAVPGTERPAARRPPARLRRRAVPRPLPPVPARAAPRPPHRALPAPPARQPRAPRPRRPPRHRPRGLRQPPGLLRLRPAPLGRPRLRRGRAWGAGELGGDGLGRPHRPARDGSPGGDPLHRPHGHPHLHQHQLDGAAGLTPPGAEPWRSPRHPPGPQGSSSTGLGPQPSPGKSSGAEPGPRGPHAAVPPPIQLMRTPHGSCPFLPALPLLLELFYYPGTGPAARGCWGGWDPPLGLVWGPGPGAEPSTRHQDGTGGLSKDWGPAQGNMGLEGGVPAARNPWGLFPGWGGCTKHHVLSGQGAKP